MIKQSYLKDFGFKLCSKNKVKFYINKQFNLTLQFTDTIGHFKNLSPLVLKSKNEIFTYESEISNLITLAGFNEQAELFKAGLPEKNLRQGAGVIYKRNTQENFGILTKEKATALAHAIFNFLISRALMTSSREDNYNYQILDYKFEYQYDSKVPKIYYTYHYKDRFGHHDFYMTYEVFAFSDKVYGMSHPCNLYLTVDDFINNFLADETRKVIFEKCNAVLGKIV